MRLVRRRVITATELKEGQMTNEQALILARNILEAGDAHLGAGMILGALAIEAGVASTCVVLGKGGGSGGYAESHVK